MTINGFLLVAAAVAPAMLPGVVATTSAPLDATVQCFRTTLGGMGRLVTINTAGGAILEFEFESVGADGRPAPAKVRFTIEDLGASRTVSALAVDPSDASLAAQLLTQTAKTCLPVGEPSPTYR